MKALVQRLWHSPTFTTWGSMATRLLAVALVLPLVLVKFPAVDVAVWQLFATIVTLQLVLDLGLAPTFARMYSYAMGGARIEDLSALGQRKQDAARQPHADTIRAIHGTLLWLYNRFGLGLLALTGLIGTWALGKPVSQMSDPGLGWAAWAAVLLSSYAGIWANAYSAAIQGFNKIATLRRWEILTSIGQIASSFAVLAFGGHLLTLVCVAQAWVIFGAWRNRRLLLSLQPDLRNCPSAPNPTVMHVLWPATWRSGVGILMSQGIIQFSGLIYSQLANASELASYLLALRVITTISQFSQAPFYSKIPTLTILYAQHKRDEQVGLARKGMAMASWVFTIGTTAVALTIEPLLTLIGSNVKFVSPLFWCLISLAFFVERVGAMHIQFYSITNHIVWHIANGITGALMIALGYLLYPSQALAAFPLAMLMAYGLFYTVYAMHKTAGAFALSPLQFESRASLPPAVLQLMLAGGLLFISLK